MATTSYTSSDYSAVFKKHYFNLADNVYSTFSNLYSMVPKTFNFGGEGGEHPVGVTFGGSVGSGSLPEAKSRKYIKPTYTRKKVYGVLDLDNETIQASAGPDAFIKATEEQTLGVIKSFNRNMARIFMNNGTGILGQFSGSSGGTATAPILTIVDTTGSTYGYVPANWEVGDIVNVNTLASKFEITAVNDSTKAVTLSRISGSDDLTGIGAGTHSVYMQNSKDADPTGALSLVTGNIHGVAQQRRWQMSANIDASGAGITPDLINQLVEDIDTEADEPPTVIGFSPVQYRKYLSLMEDQKRYPQTMKVAPRGNSRTSAASIQKANIGFSGIEYISTQGSIPIMKNKFIRPNCVWAFNMDKIEAAHAAKFGWFDNDGSVLHMKESSDAWFARYGGYMEILWNPMYVGRVHTLSV